MMIQSNGVGPSVEKKGLDSYYQWQAGVSDKIHDQKLRYRINDPEDLKD